MELASENHSIKIKCKLEEDQARSEMESLPRDIALGILSRLPITSLMQFRSVSRAWDTLSHDPNLVELHYSQSAKNNPCLILHCEHPIRNKLYFLESSDQHENEIVRKIQTPFCDVMPEFNIIASCNGLLCLSDALYSDPIYIYNPCTRQYKELPKSRQLFDDQEVLFGFGFHPVTNEYKVVKIVHRLNWYRNYHSRFRVRDHTKSEVQVFSLSSSGWRSIGKVPFRLERRSSEASVNGRLHWLTEIFDQGVGGSRRIISFDLADEQFREVPRHDCGGLNQAAYHLAVLGGCLSAVVCCHYEKLEIWVMKEYGVNESWIKEFDMEDRSVQFMKQESQEPSGIWKYIFGRRIAQVLCSLENGNIVIEYRGGVLVSNDPITGTFKKLVFEGVPDLHRAVVHVGVGLMPQFTQVQTRCFFLCRLKKMGKGDKRTNFPWT